MAVSEDGNTVYVCELNPFKVWKLTNGGWGVPRDEEQGVLTRLLGLLG